MNTAWWIVTGAAAFFGFIVVHEFGHAVAARLIGVPADQVVVRLNRWPAHVALRDEDGWHEPGSSEYEQAYAQHDPDLRSLGAFVAAGFVVQSIVMAAAVAGVVMLGASDLGVRFVRISVLVNGLYLVGDLVATSLSRSPAGDMSALLRHSPRTGAATLALLVGAHAAAFGVAN